MLEAAARRGSRKPPPAATSPAAGGTIKATVAELYADLERHQRCVVEIESLISKLESYSNGSPPPAKRRGGRPVIDPTDQVRSRKARDMRDRRARIKAAAAPLTPPKPRKRQRRAPSAPGEQPKAPPASDAAAMKKIALVTPSDANGAAPVLSTIVDKTAKPATPVEITAAVTAARKLRKAELRRLRRLRLKVAGGLAPPSLGAGFDGYRQPPSSLTEWVVDEKTGVSSRQRITEGVTPKLRDAPLHADDDA
jgi:hypothetical protein